MIKKETKKGRTTQGEIIKTQVYKQSETLIGIRTLEKESESLKKAYNRYSSIGKGE